MEIIKEYIVDPTQVKVLAINTDKDDGYTRIRVNFWKPCTVLVCILDKGSDDEKELLEGNSYFGIFSENKKRVVYRIKEHRVRSRIQKKWLRK